MLVSTYGAVCWHDATLHVHKGQRLRGWRVCGWARQWGCRQTCIHLGRPIGGKAGGKRDRQRTLRSHIRRVRIFVLLVASRASGTCPGRPGGQGIPAAAILSEPAQLSCRQADRKVCLCARTGQFVSMTRLCICTKLNACGVGVCVGGLGNGDFGRLAAYALAVRSGKSPPKTGTDSLAAHIR